MSEGAYLCRFDHACKRFDPSLTKPTVIKGIDGKAKTIYGLNPCTHGGGVGCSGWRHFTDVVIGWERPLHNRSGKEKIVVNALTAKRKEGPQ